VRSAVPPRASAARSIVIICDVYSPASLFILLLFIIIIVIIIVIIIIVIIIVVVIIIIIVSININIIAVIALWVLRFLLQRPGFPDAG
jgi:hypothetical protein